jgi:hypothetical protein
LKLVGLVEDGWIAVGGGKYDEDRLACMDGGVVDDMVVCGGAPHGLRGAV